MKNKLLLASSSASRKILLEQANIPFSIIKQSADESVCDWGLPLGQLVKEIAIHKMAHALLPTGQEGDYCFVLTADTLTEDSTGTIQGKAVDIADAKQKIASVRNGARVCTSFCLDRKKIVNGEWETDERIQKEVYAELLINIPDSDIDRYLASSPGLSCSCAIAIEGFGSQYLEWVRGSYSTIVGLPLFELRNALHQIGFFK